MIFTDLHKQVFLSLFVSLKYTCCYNNNEYQPQLLHVRTSLQEARHDSNMKEFSDLILLEHSQINENKELEKGDNITIAQELFNADLCLNLTSCTSCYTYSSKCHWCGSDEKCHSKGSIHGCMYGKSCNNTPPPDANDTRCNKISNCTECSKSAWSCHWCEFDNACHARGSVYGCLYGVDCYSNTRCQRQESEYEADGGTAAPIAVLAVVLVVLSIGLCCCTFCFCVVRYSKGAYDDLTGLIVKESGNTGTSLSMKQEQKIVAINEIDPLVPLLYLQDETEDPLLQQKQQQHVNPSSLQITSENVSSNQNANYIYQTFKMVFILSVITLFLMAFSTVYYYPAEPQYNFCNNEFDWKSIIQGMTSFKVEASVYNPNHFDLEVTSGSGVFYHDGTYVGHFELPNNTVATSNSINDYLVMATFTPDKWQALSLTTEFFRGSLTFVVEAQLDVTVPWLSFYSMHVEFKDFVVHANDMSDRHLCSCSTWDDNTTLTLAMN